MRLLPLFPLPLVLLPGAPLPLHIFEPRYRRMLADCIGGDGEFGIIFHPEGAVEQSLAAGTVGCVARVDQTESLPDGRSNVIVHGVRRFALERFVASDAPYWVGEVSDYDDEATSPMDAMRIDGRAEAVRALFERVGRAARAIADDADPLPTLPDDPARLSFAIANYVDLPVTERQRLLASREPLERLESVAEILARAVGPIEAHAAVHHRSKSNGHGPMAEG